MGNRSHNKIKADEIRKLAGEGVTENAKKKKIDEYNQTLIHDTNKANEIEIKRAGGGGEGVKENAKHKDIY